MSRLRLREATPRLPPGEGVPGNGPDPDLVATRRALRRWVLYGLVLPAVVAPFLAVTPVLVLSRETVSAPGPERAGVTLRTVLFGGLPAAPFSVLLNSFAVPRRTSTRTDLFLRGLVLAVLLALPPTACLFRLLSFTLPAP